MTFLPVLLFVYEVARAPAKPESFAAGLGWAGAAAGERRGGSVELKLIDRRRSYTVLTDRLSTLWRALSYTFSITKSIWFILA